MLLVVVLKQFHRRAESFAGKTWWRDASVYVQKEVSFATRVRFWQKGWLCAQLIITLPFSMLFWQHHSYHNHAENGLIFLKTKMKQECHGGGATNINRITIAIIYYKVYMFIYLEPQDISCIGSFVFMSGAGMPCKQPYKLRSFHVV